MAGAEIQIQAVIQLVAESGAGGGAVVSHAELGVGSEECVVAGGEAVGEFGVEACGEWRCAEDQFGGIGEGEGVQVEIGEGSVGLSE